MTVETNPAQSGIPAGSFEEVELDPTKGAPAEGEGGKPATKPAVPTKGVQLGEAPAKEPVVPNADTSDEFTYDPTGDAGLDYALNFVGKLGYSDTHPAIIAAQAGDFNLLKVELATKGVVGADAVVALAEAAYTKHAGATAEAAQALNAYAHGLAGGEAQWDAVVEWASANADADEKADLNESLAKGGAAARRAVKYIMDGYSAQNTVTKEPASAVKPEAGTSAAPANGPLTAKAYADAVLEIQRGARGRDISDNPEYIRLQQQRLQARRLGY